MTTALESVNGHERTDETDLSGYVTAQGRAEVERIAAQAEADERRIKAEAEAKATELKAAQEAEKQRIANERAAMKLEQDKAAHEARMAELAARKEAAERQAAEGQAAAEAAKQKAADEQAEKDQAEKRWKAGAFGIYIAGAVVSLPLQLLAFYDPDKLFLLAAPVFLEGLALILSWGAQYAVTHGKAVWPYRTFVLLAAAIAAGVNIWHGSTDPKIGINAGIIGALTSLGGPAVWTWYEHGRAQKLDGVLTRRERRAQEKAEAKRVAAERRAAEAKRLDDEAKAAAKKAAEQAAAEEQKRKDSERRGEHPEVWEIANARRAALGQPFVTDAIFTDAWEAVHGTRQVGITAKIRALMVASKMAMQDAAKAFENGANPQVESQMPPIDEEVEEEAAGAAEDGRKNNWGVPPVRRPGDAQQYTPGVGRINSRAATQRARRTARRTPRSGRK